MKANERWSRRAVVALAAVPVVAFAPRLFTRVEADAPEPRPALVDLVIVTTPAWPARADRTLAGFAQLERVAARLDQTYSPSASRAGAAASLWTGRYPGDHGVRSNQLALPAGTWTLAAGARDAGLRTAAFLEEPYVTTTGIGGFEQVVETAELGPQGLFERASSFRRGSDGPTLAWLHLADPGPEGIHLASLVGALLAEERGALRRSARWIVVTAWSSERAAGDARARVPFYSALPSGLSVGSRGVGAASLVGFAGAVCEVAHLSGPPAGAPPLQDDGRTLWVDLDGAGVFGLVLLPGEHGDVLRLGRTRVAPRADGTLVAEYSGDPERDDAFDIAPRELAVQMKEQYRVVRDGLDSGAPAPLEVRAPSPWRGTNGW